MKKSNFWTGILAITLVFGMAITACGGGDDSGTDPGTNPGNTINEFTSLDDFKTWLEAQPVNKASTPYTVKLNVSDLGGNTYLNLGITLFSNNDKYVSLDLSSSTFTSIDNFTFRSCSSLTSVTIPNSVTSIGNSAFEDCSSLTSVTIPNSVTSIGSSAFYKCKGLTSVTIPDSVTSIGSFAFSGCTSLTSITIPFIGASKSATTYSAVFGFIFGYTQTSSVTIPSGATYQYDDDKYNYYYYIPSSLKTVIITGNTSIGRNAFYNCKGLTSITIPNSVTRIDYSAFQNCTGLTSVTIPVSVTSIGSSAFQNCTGLTSVTIPVSVTSIGSSAFQKCTGLTSVTFEGTITSSNFNSTTPFPGDLRDKYFATEGGIGTYTRPNMTSTTWTKQ